MADNFEPRIKSIWGPMYAGKTETLARAMHKYFFAKIPTAVFKHASDVRYDGRIGRDKIMTHDGRELSAVVANVPGMIVDHITANPHVRVVGIDEVMFYDDDILNVIDDLWKSGRRVYTTGIDVYAADLRPFRFKDSMRTVGDLMAMSGEVEKLVAVCEHPIHGHMCAASAPFTRMWYRTQPSVAVGGKEMYAAVCREHHPVFLQRSGKATLFRDE